MVDVTKEQFDNACKKYEPNNWIKFAFKYFSKDTIKEDFFVKNSLIYFFVTMFLIGFISTVFNAPRAIISIATMIFSIVLLLLVLYMSSAVILNNLRIKKICKELGIEKSTYEALTEFYAD